MKTAKLVMGIVSIVLFMVVIFQSCATGVANVLGNNASDTSGAAGVCLGLAMLIAGIVGVATRNSKGGGIAAGVFYIIGAIVGFASMGTYGDLVIWSVLSLAFGIVFLIGSFTMKKEIKNDSVIENTEK